MSALVETQASNALFGLDAAPPPASPVYRPGRFAAPGPHAFGQPVTLQGFSGFLYPGDRPLGVLMLGAIGYEEMCARSTWRTLAEMISQAGLPCLRFDYPGCGDALDVEAPDGIEDWRRAVERAAAFLRQATGVERIALVGQGLGAALAMERAAIVGPVQAAALMAPLSRGKSSLRELQAWSRLLNDAIGIGPDPDDPAGLAVAGQAVPAQRAEAIRALDLTRLATRPCDQLLVLARQNHAGDASLVRHLQGLGAAVTCVAYEGYGQLVTDPTKARPPVDTLRRVVDWLDALAPAATVLRSAGSQPSVPLRTEVFEERPLRFGPEGRLFGVLCRPLRGSVGRVMVIANAGRDYHIGWGRSSVEIARALARQGVASFRYDSGAIGDSVPSHETGEGILFSGEQIQDAIAAIDLLDGLRPDGQSLGEIGVIGRCSGAYVAWQAALADTRVRRVVVVNVARFVLDPKEDMVEAARYAHRSVGSFGTALLSRKTLRRLVSGELRVVPVGRYLARRIAGLLARRVAPLLGRFSAAGRRIAEVRHGMLTLSRRGTKVSLVFSEGDAGLGELATYFGRDGRRLAACRGTRLRMVPKADHNFTHLGARQRMVDTVVGLS